MKKLFMGIGIAAMVMGMASMASAALDTTWFVYSKATTDAKALLGAPEGKFGLKGTTSTFGSVSAAYDPSIPEINYYDATHATDSRYYVAQLKYVAGTATDPTTANGVTWNFQVVGKANTPVYLTMWNPLGSTSTLDANPGFTLALYDYTGGVRGEKLYEFLPNTNGAMDATAGITGNYFQKSFAYASNPLQFQLVASNAVPEPGSMVAMLSGLAGLVGFGIRRRK